jgi:predicted SnoaL-like aldol condensation-catalyzing enzyme
MSTNESKSSGDAPRHQEEINKSIVEGVFRDVFVSDIFDAGTIARYFSPQYLQKTDGRTIDYSGFVAHVHELKRTLKNIKITFERLVAEGATVVSIHRADAEKVAGGRIAIRVFALFEIEAGKIVHCDELTHLEQGAAEDHDLASR